MAVRDGFEHTFQKVRFLYLVHHLQGVTISVLISLNYLTKPFTLSEAVVAADAGLQMLRSWQLPQLSSSWPLPLPQL